MKAILLLLLSVSVAFAKPGDAEWQKQLDASWEEVFRTYSDLTTKECTDIMCARDEAARKAKAEIFSNPNKPMIYMGWEMEKRRKAKIAAEKAYVTAAAAAWANRNQESEYEERTRKSAAEINARIKAIGRPEPRDPVRDLRNEIDDLEREQQHLKSQIRRGW